MRTKNTFSSKTDNNEDNEEEFEHKIDIVIVGNKYTGKTSFLFQYDCGMYSELYMPTTGIDFKTKNIKTYDGKKVLLKLWDTCEFIGRYYDNAHFIFNCFFSKTVHAM